MPQPNTTEGEFTIAAAYGQACLACASSKTKCRFRPGGDSCERCFRRGKECKQAPVKRRETGRRAVSRTARLEERLDNLVLLLQNQHEGLKVDDPTTTPISNIANAQRTIDQRAFEAPCPGGTSPTRESIPLTPSTSITDGTANRARASHSPAFEPEPEDISDAEAEASLQHFLITHLPHFPFMYIPPTMTAVEFRRERPFLWMCILAVATKSARKQQLLGAKIRRILADKLIVENERSIDALLGLLAYMGWANYHLGPIQPFLSMYCLLIAGLVQDLGLEKMPRRADDPQHPMACLKSTHVLVQRLALPVARTMEERRAVIAAFIITSEVSAFRHICFNRTVDGLRWNSTMDDYLQELDEKREAPLDMVLVALARLKLVRDEAVRPSWIPSQPSDQLRALQLFQAKSLLSRLEDLKRALPEELTQNDVFRLHLLDVELHINESALYHVKFRGKSPLDSQRTATLMQCAQVARSWVDIYLSFPPAVYAALTFPTWSQLSHIFTTVYRLYMFDEPGWSASVVREIIDIMQVMEELSTRFDRVAEEAGLINDRTDSSGLFSHVIKSIRTIRAAWEPKLQQPQTGSGGGGSGGADVSENMDFDMTSLDGFSAEFLDGMNGWMSDMIFSWEGQ